MLTIGQFSKVCCVSVKALRHYHRIGLLPPAQVDPWTGYRYYDESHIPAMLLIQRLKGYGFSLAEIREILRPDQPPQRRMDALRAQRAQLLQRMEQLRLTLAELDQHLLSFERTGDIMDYQNRYHIALEQTRAIPILSLRRKMAISDFDRYYAQLWERAARDKVDLTGVILSIYHDESFDRQCTDIELALGVGDPAQASGTLPGGLTAVTLHTGPYAGLSDAYGAITRWLPQHNLTMAGAPYEIYLKSRQDGLPPESWQTKVCFPVKQMK